jgi:hypothetical protein
MILLAELYERLSFGNSYYGLEAVSICLISIRLPMTNAKIHYQTNICYTEYINSMVIFHVCVGLNNCYKLHFRISDPKVVIEQVPVDGNDQCLILDNGDYLITRVEDVLQNKILGGGLP